MSRAAAALTLWVTMVGCGHAPPGPQDAVGAYVAAVEAADARAAYALMSSSYQQRVAFPAFEAQFRRGGRELQQQARRVKTRLPTAAVRIRVAEDQDTRIVRERAGWRLDELPFELYGQGTPREAVRSFLRALERADYDALLGLAPVEVAARLDTTTLRAYWEGSEGRARRARLLEALGASGDEPLLVDGEEALLPYVGGRQVRLVREQGLWRIESPD